MKQRLPSRIFRCKSCPYETTQRANVAYHACPAKGRVIVELKPSNV